MYDFKPPLTFVLDYICIVMTLKKSRPQKEEINAAYHPELHNKLLSASEAAGEVSDLYLLTCPSPLSGDSVLPTSVKYQVNLIYAFFSPFLPRGKELISVQSSKPRLPLPGLHSSGATGVLSP